MKPIAGVKTAPPTMAITIKEPPILVFGPSRFNPNAKIVGNISDMKKLVRNTAHNPTQPGSSTPTRDQRDIHQRVNAQQFTGDDEPHQVSRGEASHAESRQRTGQEISGHSLGLMRGVLDILDEIAPSSDLCADVHELGPDRPQKVRILEQVPEAAVIAAFFVFALDGGKLRPQNQQRPARPQSLPAPGKA